MNKICRINLRQKPRVSYYEPDEPNLDEYVFCSDCGDYVYEYCSIHGPLLVVPDDKVPPKPDVPSYVPRAALTIPHVFLHINYSTIPDAGLGVFTTLTLPRGVRFGPYRGKRTNEIGSSYCWQVRGANNRPSHVVDASDPNTSNWMRFVNCSRYWHEQNLVAYQYRGDIYYRTIKIIPRFTELMVFYGSEFACELNIDLKKYNSPSSFAQKLGTLIPEKVQINTQQNNTEEINKNSPQTSDKNMDPKKTEIIKSDVNNNSSVKKRVRKKATVVKKSKAVKMRLSKNENFLADNCNSSTYVRSVSSQKNMAPKVPKENSSSTTQIEAGTTDVTSSENSKITESSEFSKSMDTNRDLGCPLENCDITKDVLATELTESLEVSNNNSLKIRNVDNNLTEFVKNSTENSTDVNNNCKRKILTKYTCDICPYVTNRKKYLENHLLLHGNIKGITIYKCKYCLHLCTTKQNLKLHEFTHTGGPYTCDVCKRSFYQSSDLTRHKRIHSGDKPYTCDICKRSFSQSSALTEHKRIHTGDKPYTCDICKRSFSQSSALTRHKRIHTGEKPYTCDVCKHSFSRSSNLTTHKRIHTGEKPYTCDICKRSLSDSSALTKHKRIHTDDKRYTCDICKRSFSDSNNLTRHKRIHTGEKPYTCDICKLSFSQSSALTRHKRIHTGDKPYTCDICKRSFSDSSNLTTHKRTHTGK